MKKIIEWLLHENAPLLQVYRNDPDTIFSHAVGNGSIAFFFFTAGVVAIYFAKWYNRMTSPPLTERLRITQLFGAALILCGLSRVVSLIAIWHNFGHLQGLLEITTGTVAGIASIYSPLVLRALKRIGTLSQARSELDSANAKLDALQKLKDKHDTP